MDETLPHFNPTPMISANCVSKALFCWLNPLFKKGHKNELCVEDLYNVPAQDSADHLGTSLEREWEKEVKKSKDSEGKSEPSLLKALMRLFGLQYLLLGMIVFTEETIRVVQPLLLGGLIQYFTAGSAVSPKQACLYAMGVSLCTVTIALTHHSYFFNVARIGMRMRIACCSLMFKKALQLNDTGMNQTSTGHIVNLMSNDVSRLDKLLKWRLERKYYNAQLMPSDTGCIMWLPVMRKERWGWGPLIFEGAMFLHFLWIGPLQAIAVMVILWHEMGPSVIGGVVILLLFIPVQGTMGRIFSKLRHKTAVHTDERVKMMNEIIAGIRVIKMYCWEKPFGQLVEKVRRSEVDYVWAKKRIASFTSSVWLFAHRVLSYALVVMHIGLGGTLRVAPLYIALSFMFLLAYNGIGCVFEAVSLFSEFCVASVRIQNFLLLAERHKKESSVTRGEEHVLPEDGMVVIDNLTAKWNPNGEQTTVEQISVTVRTGQLLAVIGPVGAGKSSLLMAILGELQASSGGVSVKGKVAYVSQQAWVFSGSVRQNILFGSPYDKGKFDRVVRASALQKDLEIMPQGDSTLIGDRGISLSGGQRARVSLARALYTDADVYLLDDPLSAVDATVGHHIFQKCIQGMLRGKTKILVTHQLQYLTAADSILILKEGRAVGMGTYEELSNSGIDFAELLRSDEEEEGTEDAHLLSVPEPSSPLFVGCGSQLSLISTTTDFEPDPVQLPEEEERETGRVGWGVYVEYLRAGTGLLGFLLLLLLLVVAQCSYILSDWWLSRWSTAEEDRLAAVKEHHSLLSQGHNHTNVTIPVVDGAENIYVYTAIIVGVFVFGLLRALFFFRVMVDASQSLHNRMFARILRCPVGFFDTHPVGRILNRFAKDIDHMDDSLPITFFDFVQCFLLVVSIVLVAGVVNPLVFIPTLPILVLFFYIRHYYLSTSRDVKRLEGVARSPVYSYLSASLQGLHTIRAFKMEEKCAAEFSAHQDGHSEAWLLVLASSRWLASRLDWLCALFVTSVTFCAVLAVGSLDAGLVGLSVTYSMTLMGMFQWGVRQSAEVENQMVSVERVLEYSRLPSEAELESSEKAPLPPDWPHEGSITADDLCLRFAPDKPVVLKNISFHIKAREKIGIVGRTGAGKSSLITALFRLVEPSGHLTIDGVDVCRLGLHDLRKAISIIPQDPVLFTGTLRRNLDPFLQHSDQQLWMALAEVQLKSTVEDLPCRLETPVYEGGVNFSVGQRQLVCLARAILRQNCILVIDEATANVDPQTDELIQQTIQHKFRQCTVLTIAHRLHTIMESHRVMVLSEGQIVEMDAPHRLLQNPSGAFSCLVQQTGKTQAQYLTGIAANAHHRRLGTGTESGSSGFESSVADAETMEGDSRSSVDAGERETSEGDSQSSADAGEKDSSRRAAPRCESASESSRPEEVYVSRAPLAVAESFHSLLKYEA